MAFLDEAKKLYEDRGRELIRRLLPEFEGLMAVGLAGHGDVPQVQAERGDERGRRRRNAVPRGDGEAHGRAEAG